MGVSLEGAAQVAAKLGRMSRLAARQNLSAVTRAAALQRQAVQRNASDQGLTEVAAAVATEIRVRDGGRRVTAVTGVRKVRLKGKGKLTAAGLLAIAEHGTGERRRKSGGSTGSMPPMPVMGPAYHETKDACQAQAASELRQIKGA